MNCLCCGKPLRPPVPSCGWHSSCIKRFFGTADFPELELTNETLALLADQSVNHGYTVPGVRQILHEAHVRYTEILTDDLPML